MSFLAPVGLGLPEDLWGGSYADEVIDFGPFSNLTDADEVIDSGTFGTLTDFAREVTEE